MRKLRENRYSILLFLSLGTFFIIFACKKEVQEVEPVAVDPFEGAPYQTLSEYGFFTGAMKDQNPSTGVLPYKTASKLFTDYARKKRFIWMPECATAKYNGDAEILDMPVGTALIKTFYYNNVLPSNETKIIETRIMIKRSSGWIFAEYIWNDEQTEAFLDMNGSYKNISWLDDNNNQQTANYRIPSETECKICHKFNDAPIPIGVKPQNLNWAYDYGSGPVNQLQKMQEVGYLDQSLPGSIVSVVDYTDDTQSIDLRMRSYLDINCAHCHSEGSHCDYRPIRLAFDETEDPVNMGLCVAPDEQINTVLTNIIAPANKDRSVMYFRLNTDDEDYRMPLLGRSMVHQEAVDLLEEWINAHPDCN